MEYGNELIVISTRRPESTTSTSSIVRPFPLLFRIRTRKLMVVRQQVDSYRAATHPS